MTKLLLRLAGSGLIALVLTGCVARFDPDTMQLRADVEAPPVYEGHSVGQTFIAARQRLCAIEVGWQTCVDVMGPLVFHLRSDPTSTDDLASGKISPSHRLGQQTIRWRFPPITHSQGRQFYLLIEAPQATLDHPLRLNAVGHDVYIPGSAYADGLPWPGDLNFLAFYDYDRLMFLGDMTRALSEVWLFLPVAALFWAPGFLVLQFGQPHAVASTGGNRWRWHWG